MYTRTQTATWCFERTITAAATCAPLDVGAYPLLTRSYKRAPWDALTLLAPQERCGTESSARCHAIEQPSFIGILYFVRTELRDKVTEFRQRLRRTAIISARVFYMQLALFEAMSALERLHPDLAVLHGSRAPAGNETEILCEQDKF